VLLTFVTPIVQGKTKVFPMNGKHNRLQSKNKFWQEKY